MNFFKKIAQKVVLYKLRLTESNESDHKEY